MSTLMIKQTSTSEKVSTKSMSANSKSSNVKTPTSASHSKSSDSEVEVVTLPKPRTKRSIKKSPSGSKIRGKDVAKDAEPTLACGGQILASKLPVIGPPVLFDETQLRVAFSLLDVNGDGAINCEELFNMLNKLGLKDFINEHVVKSLILDANREVNPEIDEILITEEQFINWMPRLGLTASNETLPSTAASSTTSSTFMEQYASTSTSSSRKESLVSDIRKGSLASQSSSSTTSSASSYHSASSRPSIISATDSRRSSNSGSTMTSSTPRSSIGSSCVSGSSSVPNNSRSSSIVDMGDGGEFRKKSLEEEDAEKDLRAAFSVFDQDKNGFITRDELINAMSFLGENLTEADIDNLIMNADTDKDGQINYEEFINALM